ncbi:uncharacterized protein LOC123500864 [Portunus trituberculatus]|uniref:uncharacterized protein LOC123500864 n=1 Tax=Portunus trituberculatus TaxID=210409 RepID=UPI001E1CE155|nr:uncharacterized protein LOC123500864 [Portunus trituberculatus]
MCEDCFVSMPGGARRDLPRPARTSYMQQTYNTRAFQQVITETCTEPVKLPPLAAYPLHSTGLLHTPHPQIMAPCMPRGPQTTLPHRSTSSRGRGNSSERGTALASIITLRLSSPLYGTVM